MTATATSPDVRVIAYTDEEASRVAELLNAGLGQKQVGVRDAEYWRWKHERNPFGRSFTLLAEADGRLVGVRAFMRWEFECDGRIVRAAKPVDSVTHPDYQRRGIFSQLTLAACEIARDEGTEFLFNTPNSKSKPGYLKLGWQEVGELPVYARVLRPVAAGVNTLRWKLQSHNDLSDKSFFSKQPMSAREIVRDRRFEDLVAARQCSPGVMETVRNLRFLRWRYCEHPHIEYFTEQVERNGRLDGVLFYRMNFRGGNRELMIDDFLIRPEASGNVLKSLMRQLRATVNCEYWVAHAGNRSSLFDSTPLWRVPRKKVTLTARSCVGEAPEIGKWSLCFGDIEGL